MARRKHSGEVNIGSDSFLDVIANMVGILIILIVIAGVRVSRAPVSAKAAAEAGIVIAEVDAVDAIAPVEQPAPIEDEPPLEVEFALEPAPQPLPEIPLEPLYVELTEPSAELKSRLDELRGNIARLQNELTLSARLKQDLEQREVDSESRIKAERQTLQAGKSQHASRNKQLAELKAEIAAQQSSLAKFQQELQRLEAQGLKPQGIKHRVTPISRIVSSEQHHYRLINNKVSRIPLKELLEAAMRQAKRQMEEMTRKRNIVGTAGPIEGYFLQYKLEPRPASAAEAAQFGPGLVRITLTSFELSPDTGIVEETADEALVRGSRFDLAVQTAEPQSVFTLWVYPDSFPLYRKLQAKLHDAGYTVAGRPLPMGIPIAGSPEGSASAGQ